MTKRIFALFLILCLLAVPALAAETDADQVYCFTPEDFGSAEDPLVGICITGLPESSTGTVWLNSRVVRPGDILTADQVSQLTFSPVRTEQDATAQLSYLPIYDGRVAPSATMTLSIRGKEDKAPVAQDMTLETYKNLPLEEALKCQDPEGEALTFTVLRQPRRGTVELHADGSFTYTPKRNKVGVDSFTYTATEEGSLYIMAPTASTSLGLTISGGLYANYEYVEDRAFTIAEPYDNGAGVFATMQVYAGDVIRFTIQAAKSSGSDGIKETSFTLKSKLFASNRNN